MGVYVKAPNHVYIFAMKILTIVVKHVTFLTVFLYCSFASMNIVSYNDIIRRHPANNLATHILAFVYLVPETTVIIIAGMFFSENII
jgi:uncharacterized membrane protein